MKYIIFVSENVNKFKEMENYLENMKNAGQYQSSDIHISMYKPHEEIYEIQSLDRKEIINQKLKNAYLEVVKHGNYVNTRDDIEYWIMVEDTSFYIDRENGFPGPFIKFYLEVNPLSTIANKNWASNAYSIVSLGISRFHNTQHIQPTDQTDHNDINLSPIMFEGQVDGKIVIPAGENGFGFDSIFMPNNSNKTNAQMSMEEKADFNPRIMAFKKIIEYIS